MPEGLCRRPHRRHEGIYILAKSEHHSFRTRPPVPSVWRLTQTPNLTPHCSTFPLDLPLTCIEAANSGTTARAARLLGHHYLGFELAPDHCSRSRQYINGPL